MRIEVVVHPTRPLSPEETARLVNGVQDGANTAIVSLNNPGLGGFLPAPRPVADCLIPDLTVAEVP